MKKKEALIKPPLNVYLRVVGVFHAVRIVRRCAADGRVAARFSKPEYEVIANGNVFQA